MRRFAIGLLVFLAACKVTSEPFCLEIDGPCANTAQPGSFIFGFPYEKLDTRASVGGGAGYAGTLHVGDMVLLHLVSQPRGEVTQATDTVRSVGWGLTDSLAAHIESLPNGVGRLTAIAPGRVGLILANGSSQMWSCHTESFAFACSSVARIDVVP